MSLSKTYTGDQLNYIGFPLGGIGTGMFNVEGSGSFSAFSIRNAPDTNLEPLLFSAVTVKGEQNISRVIESQVPKYKVFGGALAPLEKKPKKVNPLAVTKANGLDGKSYGLPRFKEAVFKAEFPFATIDFADQIFPLKTKLCAWSPFTPPNADDSSYPMAFLEYTFTNTTSKRIDAVYYYNSMNFMAIGYDDATGDKRHVYPYGNGFVLKQDALENEPWAEGAYGAFIDEPNVKVNTALFRGGWYDTLTMLWNDIQAGKSEERIRADEQEFPNPGASMSVEFSLEPGESKTIVVNCCWYVPESSLRIGHEECCCCCENKADKERYKPWYTTKFDSIECVADYTKENRERLFGLTKKFTDTFFASTLPEIVLEAVSANLTIIKSPTVLRQTDGRLWCWEGCCDSEGCCAGSCTHVWNYAQAICNLFPELERGFRQTEFFDSQNEQGHQNFRTSLPIGETNHDFHAASDGQLGGVIKTYRDFTICGDVEWLKKLWPKVKASMQYCIHTWDKKREGVLREPHHNTYDIEFWGADGMCTSFYLSALEAMIEMSKILGEDHSEYSMLLEKGSKYLEDHLYNGEYFYQQVQWEGLEANAVDAVGKGINDKGSKEAMELVWKYGPKYQYGTGCISDGVLGFWMAKVAGLEDPCDAEKITQHLRSVYKYNLKDSLLEHSNPQRSGYALGDESGLLLCTWPHGEKPALPFVYSDEVWTGIEYQVASHLIFMGEVEKGLEIAEKCRSRYQGNVRNPFDEYECGHWYARAMSSYALIQALTGIRYNAYTKTLYIDPKISGDFDSFLSTNTGYGLAGMKGGKPYLKVVNGSIDVENIVWQKKA